MKLQNINMLYWLWLIPVLAAVYAYGWRKRRKRLEAFIDAGLIEKIKISGSNLQHVRKALVLLVAIGLLIFAMTRPAWNFKSETIERKGRDVVFVLDVSRSMLAEDLTPNRLERAKIAIMDCVERLRGDRVGLVAFSGIAAVKCPLTFDYGFFQMILETISTDSISRGGTMIGDAIRKTVDEVFDDQAKEFKDIILITDGEDHESFPIEAAKSAGEKGARIIAIGLGDENEGRRIPITNEKGLKTFLTYKGQEIWSKLDSGTLRRMVVETPGGKYLNVSTGTIDLGKVYLDLVASASKKDIESESIQQHEEKFQIFLGAAFVLFCIEMVMRERVKNSKNG